VTKPLLSSDFSEERSSCKVEIIAPVNGRGQVSLC